jgi:NodT family efflux transporter outer membrane factor (OMF) lipoprotein
VSSKAVPAVIAQRTRLAWLAPLALLAACTVGPRYHTPVEATPAAFPPRADAVPSRTDDSAVEENWWKSFADPELSSLVDRLVKQNLDLATAAERVAQARAQRAVVASQGLPHLDGRASYMHERASKNGMSSLFEPAPDAPLEFNLWDDSLSASWELDLFGRVRRAIEAADADTAAAVEGRRSVVLASIADLAQTYMQLRGVQAQEAVTRRYVEVAQHRAKLVRDRHANDVATLADVAQADAQAATIAQDLPTLRTDEARLINLIGLLLGEPPRTLEAELSSPPAQPPVPPTVPIGIPSDLARRRPDIREAEAVLHAATAQTGVAVANFYPDVTLTGSFGSESLHPSSLFDWASRMFAVGPAIDIPLFEGGRLTGTLRLREAAQRSAAVAYHKTVLQAWHDVDNALTAYAEIQHRQTAVADAERQDELALRLSEQRYQQGVADLLDVITAQTEVLKAQNALAQAQTDLETNLVRLYKALGGGWQTAEPPAG